MKNLILLLVILLTLSTNIFAQGVGINTTGADADASAILDVSSTTQGFLPPRMTESQRTAISSPATGLLVFQTNGTSGLYYYTGTQWQVISAVKPSHSVGDNAIGGIVFYVNSDGTHGLVSAAQDQLSLIDWYNAHDNLNNPANHDSEGDKYSDWRLPSKYELNLMYQQRTTIGGFASDNYWSGTEGVTNSAVRQNFFSGVLTDVGKNSTAYVRAVRAF